MLELITLLFVIVTGALVFGVPIYFVRRYLRLREREVAALEGKRAGGPAQLLLEEENRSLRERVEKLEAIITSADFDLNRKLAALDVPGENRGQLPPPKNG
jgi:hypothetical protein